MKMTTLSFDIFIPSNAKKSNIFSNEWSGARMNHIRFAPTLVVKGFFTGFLFDQSLHLGNDVVNSFLALLQQLIAGNNGF